VAAAAAASHGPAAFFPPAFQKRAPPFFGAARLGGARAGSTRIGQASAAQDLGKAKNELQKDSTPIHGRKGIWSSLLY